VIATTAPGKLNLCLFVGAPREDGYHPLVSVFQSVSLADELTLEHAPAAHRDEVVCPGVSGPNLASRALAAYREASGWDGPPVRITVTKRVPVAAGMGGGSGDAAATLRLAAEAAGRPGDPLLAELAPALGADVPFQLAGGRALVTGIGERIERLPPGPPAAMVVYPSEHALSTPAVYAEFDRIGRSSDLAQAEADLRGGALPNVNDLQDAARSLCPSIDRALDQLHTAGAGEVLVAGSGPTVFGRFDDRERAAAVAAVLPGAVAVEPL
jgi:4-diphosphocytidyl-2-C-methyl-D-erythritol kinase